MKPWFIKNTDFPGRLPKRELAVFRRICPERRYAKGKTIFLTGDPATDMHVIAAGQVKLVAITPSGNERILALCGPEDFIGEAFLHEDAFHRADAVALTEVITCPISRAKFLRLARKAPAAVLTLAEVLAGHLSDCREQLSDAYAPIKNRVVKTLLEQARRFGKPQEGSWVQLHTELHHHEIAAIVSASRVSVTTTFIELREEGALEGSRGNYRLNVSALESLLESFAS